MKRDNAFFLRKGFNYCTGFKESREDCNTRSKKRDSKDVLPEARKSRMEVDVPTSTEYRLNFDMF